MFRESNFENASSLGGAADGVLRHPDGSIKCADLIFIADVPSLGYRTYFVRDGDGAQVLDTDIDVSLAGSGYPGMITGMLTPDDGRMSNSLINVRASLRTGAIQSLTWRASNWDIVDAAHEVVLSEESELLGGRHRWSRVSFGTAPGFNATRRSLNVARSRRGGRAPRRGRRRTPRASPRRAA